MIIFLYDTIHAFKGGETRIRRSDVREQMARVEGYGTDR